MIDKQAWNSLVQNSNSIEFKAVYKYLALIKSYRKEK